jgi:hypothetical protein
MLDRIVERLRRIGSPGHAAFFGRDAHNAPDTEGVDPAFTIVHAWRDHFAPVVRAYGFKGSGRTFRLIGKRFVLVIQLGAGKYGGKFCVSLCVHPLCVSDAYGGALYPKTIKDYQCGFRTCLSSGRRDIWWRYGATARSKHKAARKAADLFRARGMAQFEELMHVAMTATPEMVKYGLYVDFIAFALFREYQGDLIQAQAFAMEA